MKRRYLLLTALVGLMWTACGSEKSSKATDTLALDSPAVSDSLDIKATDADSITLDTIKK
ncbi:hypothetical protein [Pedobacter ureilyticus]|uniref:Uncharacterized protein n=1 Tax=Pedobacter ureilyticus TaxID=1393051 RepID=A0ABW9J0Y1_9SPHI|nr:hypothetical protein [Pedobacter helvus]